QVVALLPAKGLDGKCDRRNRLASRKQHGPGPRRAAPELVIERRQYLEREIVRARRLVAPFRREISTEDIAVRCTRSRDRQRRIADPWRLTDFRDRVRRHRLPAVG